jgi:hypothetical protein
MIAAAIAIPSLCLLSCAVIGTLIEVHEKQLVGKWVDDPTERAITPAEFQNLGIELFDDGERCEVFKDGLRWTTTWEIEPSFETAEGWLDFPDTQAKWGGPQRLVIRSLRHDTIELFDEETGEKKVRLKRVQAFDRRFIK